MLRPKCSITRAKVETDYKVSKSAKEIILNALQDETTGRAAIKKYGETYFGYRDFGALGPALNTEEGATQGFAKAYIRLEHFDVNGANSIMRDYSNLDALGISRRVYNMARVYEHEWIGHVLNKTGDGGDNTPGKTVTIVNEFQKR